MSQLRICLVSSSGGVLQDMAALRPWWERHQRTWVSVPAPDTTVVLAGERVVWRPERSAGSLLRLPHSLVDAYRVLRRERPDVVVSAGTGVAVGFFVVAKLLRVPTVWLETLNMVATPGLASRACMRAANVVLVQRPELLATRRRSVLVGQLY
ncbi:MAG: UDP-N-acetylglucosamine--LPS N-acetylglucosamine transferase [Ilumatobacteraceae bacterium]